MLPVVVSGFLRVILFFLRKKRRTNRDVEANYAGLAMAFPSLSCWKGQSDESYTVLEPQQVSISSNGAAYSDDEQRHLRSNSTKDMFAMPFGGEDTEDAELWCYAGPSRLLFTIIEETEEDLETEDGESTVGENTERSAERTLRNMLEMSQEDDSTLMPSSPPPTLKFLMDAEEKHYKKMLMDKALKVQRSCNLNESREKKEASVAPILPLLPPPPQAHGHSYKDSASPSASASSSSFLHPSILRWPQLQDMRKLISIFSNKQKAASLSSC